MGQDPEAKGNIEKAPDAWFIVLGIENPGDHKKQRETAEPWKL